MTLSSGKINVIRGDDTTIGVTFTDENGTAIDITGYTVFFTVKDENGINIDSDTNAIISKDVTSHFNPTAGETKIALVPADTSGKKPGKYLWDIQLKSTSGLITSTMIGEFILEQDVTKRTDVTP